MNYLQYIHSVAQPREATAGLNYLVSGADSRVREVIGKHILDTVYESGKILFLVDNTQSGSILGSFGQFRVVNLLNSEVDLCHDLLGVSSLKEISRLRSLLVELGFDSIKAMKVINYLTFVQETERRLGNAGPLRVETLEEYGGTKLVEWKLRQVLEKGKISQASFDYLMARYFEVSAAAADFELFLVMLAPFLSGRAEPAAGTAVHLPIGEFREDRPMQEVMCKLMLAFIKKQPSTCTILIIDDGKCDRGSIIDVLKSVPTGTDVHLLTADAFSLNESERNVLMNTFHVRLYSRHESMASCAIVENCCGHIDVVKHSYTTTVDKRLRSYSALDLLLGTNRTEAVISNAPVREPRYRKEVICAFAPGFAIIDCGGVQTLFQF